MQIEYGQLPIKLFSLPHPSRDNVNYRPSPTLLPIKPLNSIEQNLDLLVQEIKVSVMKSLNQNFKD